jgi:hypothetical protein
MFIQFIIIYLSLKKLHKTITNYEIFNP